MKGQETKNWIKRIIYFVDKGVLEINDKECSLGKRLLIRTIKTIKIAIHGFFNDNLQLRASALTFYTALSIVPIIAILLGLASGFGMQNLVESTLMDQFPAQKEVFKHIFEFSEKSLKHAQGVFFGVGLVFLMWAVLNVFGQVERSFNEIWQIKRGRTLLRQFTDYMGLVLILPIFMILSSAFTVIFRTKLEGVETDSLASQFVNPLGEVLLHTVPYFINFIIFTLMFLIMPNRRIRFTPALIAGIFTGICFQLLQSLFIKGQVLLTGYSATYGSFAALPLFLLLMQLSWIITLVGAELSFAIQNVGDFDFENRLSKLSQNYQRRLAVLITSCIVKNYISDEAAPLSNADISEQEQLPLRLVNEITSRLTDAGILAEIVCTDKDNVYQPALTPDKLSIALVSKRYDSLGVDTLHWQQESTLHLAIKKRLDDIDMESQQSALNALLKNIEHQN